MMVGYPIGLLASGQELLHLGYTWVFVTSMSLGALCVVYREVQLDFTPEMEIFYMLFDRCHTKSRKEYISKSILNISISGVKFSWTILYSLIWLRNDTHKLDAEGKPILTEETENELAETVENECSKLLRYVTVS